jgi:hypothetical protein
MSDLLDSPDAPDQHRGLPQREAMLKNNPMMKRLVQSGEERMSRIAQQLLSNEKFLGALQTLVSSSLAAKGTLDKSLRAALAAMNLPSTADLEALSRKVDDLEQLLSSVEAKVDLVLSPKKE